MSIPPFIAMPDGVAALGPGDCPAPVLLAEPVRSLGDVLMVPGFTGSKEDFIAVLAPLAALGWRVAAMDLPGQNGFPGLGPRGSHTTQSLARSVVSVVDWLAPDRRVHLVGHSMGGLVTRDVVLSAPDRLASWTVMCTGPGAVPEAAHRGLRELQAALAALPIEAVCTLVDSANRKGGWTPPSPEVDAFLTARFCATDPVALADFADILLTAPDLTDQTAVVLADRHLPAAVVTGELDDAWPIAAQSDMAERLGVPWHLVAGVGHSPAAEDPTKAATVLHDILSGALPG